MCEYTYLLSCEDVCALLDLTERSLTQRLAYGSDQKLDLTLLLDKIFWTIESTPKVFMKSLKSQTKPSRLFNSFNELYSAFKLLSSQ